MRGRVWLLAGIVATVGFGAAEAQAGTVFKACFKSPGSTYTGECGNVFIADAGQENDVEFSPLYEAGAFYELFSEPGQIIRPPVGARHDYFGREDALGQPVVHETLLGCRFTGFNARCDNEYDNCCNTGFDQSRIYLGDRDDTLLVRNRDGVMPSVYGEEGNDTARTLQSMTFVGGPGSDELIGEGQIRYPFETGADVALHIDLDGVADDGRPGENDNVHPGQRLNIELIGDHTVIGHDGVDHMTLRWEGSNHIEGLGGNDDISAGWSADTVLGGAGNDNLRGDDGDDVLDGGPGSDFIIGEFNADTIYAQDGEPDHVDCGFHVDTAHVDAVDTVIDCENVIVG